MNLVVDIIDLDPRTYWTVQYKFKAPTQFQFRVLSPEPVDAFVVNEHNMHQWQQGNVFQYSGEMPDQKTHHWSGVLPAGHYWFVVQNRLDHSIQATVEVPRP